MLGYFDKAQTVILDEVEHQGVIGMALALQAGNAKAFAEALKKFESKNADLAEYADLENIASSAIALGKGNPYSVIQEVVAGLERAGVPMSASYSLKLSMWLRQLDRYIQIVPGFDLYSVITSTL